MLTHHDLAPLFTTIVTGQTPADGAARPDISFGARTCVTIHRSVLDDFLFEFHEGCSQQFFIYKDLGLLIRCHNAVLLTCPLVVIPVCLSTPVPVPFLSLLFPTLFEFLSPLFFAHQPTHRHSLSLSLFDWNWCVARTPADGKMAASKPPRTPGAPPPPPQSIISFYLLHFDYLVVLNIHS